MQNLAFVYDTYSYLLTMLILVLHNAFWSILQDTFFPGMHTYNVLLYVQDNVFID